MAFLLDHIDLRVRDLAACAPFYNGLLPLLGFTEKVEIKGWLQFEAPGPGVREFFGVTESPFHRPGENRIAFRVGSAGEVDRLALELRRLGAGEIEGPGYEGPGYYAVYFADPSGNRLEICHRTQRFNPG